jgi:membrane protein implicated in regulation of membrane protease activity
MGLGAIGGRWWAGGAALAMALGLLVAGETFLRERLSGLGFILYWLACFGFTALAVLLALLYVRALRGRSHQEQRQLLEQTLGDIAKESRTRGRRNLRL